MPTRFTYESTILFLPCILFLSIISFYLENYKGIINVLQTQNTIRARVFNATHIQSILPRNISQYPARNRGPFSKSRTKNSIYIWSRGFGGREGKSEITRRESLITGRRSEVHATVRAGAWLAAGARRACPFLSRRDAPDFFPSGTARERCINRTARHSALS